LGIASQSARGYHKHRHVTGRPKLNKTMLMAIIYENLQIHILIHNNILYISRDWQLPT
jgi:hypothetical protein